MFGFHRFLLHFDPSYECHYRVTAITSSNIAEWVNHAKRKCEIDVTNVAEKSEVLWISIGVSDEKEGRSAAVRSGP
ncbi:MAG: hypothetical protein IH914_01360 [candidate division Zixibacteria bacterium]|nr:hypothetical protein [candidate division Zixibacteria bacterium]